ncbi:MAG: DNA polymerase III subunit gamma/tau, partial [Alphaproteobacteria bacterium]|nr:DNA polymerase III subunit gamma/tau [Alphaproteobacteria bacterium]
GTCANCTAIAEDRHVDVIEMDAASRTGVGDIRELIEGVRYLPVMARTKVYIVDEVHMLSGAAFNALLKTLEEPPPHVKFIFATTEIRKIPVTVLSRCQRFDLRRVDEATLAGHFARICAAEGIRASDEAIALVARAADGSVRDGLSLLDQAITLAPDDGSPLAAEPVRAMLGLADRARLFELAEALFAGQAATALEILAELNGRGADPGVVVQDLLEIVHFLSRAKAVPATLTGPGVPELERVRGGSMAERLSVPVLARAWQLLLKGLSEVQTAPRPLAAAEMVLMRFAFLADLPDPARVLRALQDSAEAGRPEAGRPEAGRPAPAATAGGGGGAPDAAEGARPAGGSVGGSVGGGPGAPRAAVGAEGGPVAFASVATAARQAPRPEGDGPRSLAEIAALAAANREALLLGQIRLYVHPVAIQPGRMEVRLAEAAPKELAGTLKQRLELWTGRPWAVVLANAQGGPTLKQQEEAALERRRARLAEVPLVKAVLEAFPNAVLDLAAAPPPASPSAPPPPDSPPESPPAAAEDYADMPAPAYDDAMIGEPDEREDER